MDSPQNHFESYPWRAARHPSANRFAIILGIMMLMSGSCLLYGQSLSDQVKAQLDAIRKAGYPASVAELEKWYPEPPPGQNAAALFEEAFSHYASFDPMDRAKLDLLPVAGFANLPSRNQPIPEEMKRVSDEYLVMNQEALKLLHKAAQMKQCRYPTQSAAGTDFRLERLQKMRHGARLLCLDAMMHAEQVGSDRNQKEEAVRSVVDSLSLARSLSNEPYLISHLVRVACHLISVRYLERVLNRTAIDDPQCERLRAAFSEAEDLQAVKRTLISERCYGINAFEAKDAVLSEKDRLDYLNTMAQLLEASELSLPERLKAVEAVEAKVKGTQDLAPQVRTLLPVLPKAFAIDARNIAALRTAQAALSVERYRIAHGKLPDKLANLAPLYLQSVPIDPFDGNPIRYKKLAKGFVVYSVGEDREDNGGAEQNSLGKKYEAGTDITFAVER